MKKEWKVCIVKWVCVCVFGFVEYRKRKKEITIQLPITWAWDNEIKTEYYTLEPVCKTMRKRKWHKKRDLFFFFFLFIILLIFCFGSKQIERIHMVQAQMCNTIDMHTHIIQTTWIESGEWTQLHVMVVAQRTLCVYYKTAQYMN